MGEVMRYLNPTRDCRLWPPLRQPQPSLGDREVVALWAWDVLDGVSHRRNGDLSKYLAARARRLAAEQKKREQAEALSRAEELQREFEARRAAEQARRDKEWEEEGRRRALLANGHKRPQTATSSYAIPRKFPLYIDWREELGDDAPALMRVGPYLCRKCGAKQILPRPTQLNSPQVLPYWDFPCSSTGCSGIFRITDEHYQWAAERTLARARVAGLVE